MSSSFVFKDQSLLFPQSTNERRNLDRQKSMVHFQLNTFIAKQTTLNLNSKFQDSENKEDHYQVADEEIGTNKNNADWEDESHYQIPKMSKIARMNQN